MRLYESRLISHDVAFLDEVLYSKKNIKKKTKSIKQLNLSTKQVLDELEKSCLMEEHEQQHHHVGYLSDGSQNSKKKKEEKLLLLLRVISR